MVNFTIATGISALALSILWIIIGINNLFRTVDSTHKIVNNQRTVMLKLVTELRERIAKENPNDEAAQIALIRARDDLRSTTRII